MFGFSWQDFSSKAQESLTTISQQAANGLNKIKESTNEFIEKQKQDYQQIEHDSELKRRKEQQRKLDFDKARPPWYYNPESKNNNDINNNDSNDSNSPKNNIESIRKELKLSILQLSDNLDNFLNEAPSSSSVFQFNLDIAMPYAKVALNTDPKLQSIRYQLVPKKIKENQFWKNYFYRVQVIRESLGVPKLNLISVEKEKIDVKIEKNKNDNDNESKIDENKNENLKKDEIDDNEIDKNEKNEKNKNENNDKNDKNNNIVNAHEFVSDELDVDELTDKEKESIKKELGIKEDEVDDDEVNDLLTSINADGDDISDISDGELEKALENTN